MCFFFFVGFFLLWSTYRGNGGFEKLHFVLCAGFNIRVAENINRLCECVFLLLVGVADNSEAPPYMGNKNRVLYFTLTETLRR